MIRAAKKPGAAMAALAAVAAALAAVCGCESAEGNAVEISASRRDFTAKGQTATLSASGWSDCSWSLSDPKIGRLSRATGSSVTYTAISIPAAGSSYLNQTVTCQALGAGGAAGTIVLRHVSQGGSAKSEESVQPVTPQPGPGTLEITPASASVSSSRRTVRISVKTPSDGAKYTWKVIDQEIDTGSGSSKLNLGYVSPTSGTSTTYTAPSPLPTGAGNAIVECSDGTTSARCTISFN